MIGWYNKWEGMGENVMYEDEERGGSSSGGGYWRLGKGGMGEYWVVDVLKGRMGWS